MPVEVRYWDSCVFLALLEPDSDAGLVADCQAVVAEAEQGKLKIVTSALGMAEVLHVRGRNPLDLAARLDVNEFFQRTFIVVRDLDRRTAELAQDLFWDEGIEPKDAVHVATALIAPIPRLDTTDAGLLAKNGIQYNGLGPLTIVKPDVSAPPFSFPPK